MILSGHFVHSKDKAQEDQRNSPAALMRIAPKNSFYQRNGGKPKKTLGIVISETKFERYTGFVPKKGEDFPIIMASWVGDENANPSGPKTCCPLWAPWAIHTAVTPSDHPSQSCRVQRFKKSDSLDEFLNTGEVADWPASTSAKPKVDRFFQSSPGFLGISFGISFGQGFGNLQKLHQKILTALNRQAARMEHCVLTAICAAGAAMLTSRSFTCEAGAVRAK